MVDFSKWVDAWNAYDPGGRAVAGSPAGICSGIGAALVLAGAVLTIVVMLVLGLTDKGEDDRRSSRILASLCALVILGAALMLASSQLPSHTASNTKPPSLSGQIERTWGLDDLSGCNKTNANGTLLIFGDTKLPDSRLKDGDWECIAYTDDGKQYVTVHIKGDKVGLYDMGGDALKTKGKR